MSNSFNKENSTPLAGVQPRLRIPLLLAGLSLLGIGYWLGEHSVEQVEKVHWRTADILAEAQAQVTCHTPPMVQPDPAQFLPADYHLNNPHIPFVVWPEHVPGIIPTEAFPVEAAMDRSIAKADAAVQEANETNTIHQKIPSVVHYTFGLGDDSEELEYYQYLAIRSALIVLKPKAVLFHYINEPYGPWWDRLKDLPEAVHVVARNMTHIFHQPVDNEESKSDVIRLEALLRWGGVFLEPDVFVIRDFLSAGLLNEPVVMGMESQIDMKKHELDPTGLNNAVILAEPNSRFIRDWYNSYGTFNQSEPAKHSLEIPWKFARLNPSYVTVLNRLGLFWPLHTEDALEMVHSKDPESFNFDLTAQFTYHAWEKVAHDLLEKITPLSLKTMKSPFAKMAKRFAAADDEHYLQGYSRHSKLSSSH